jgi:BirA family biotin operon repressor/biotin-[acetyl-CoA-carboxylase] ligase
LFPLIGALAVAKTINYFGLSPSIKWPNDVRVDGKKIAGILLESETHGNQSKFLILGIGINLNIDINQFPDELKDNATSVSYMLTKSVDDQKFLEKLLSILDKYYEIFLKGEYEKILSDWRSISDTLGRKVKIITNEQEIIGLASDVDESGFLIIESDSGERKKILSGDCIYLEDL